MSDSRVHLLICWNVIIVISTLLFVYTGRAINLLFLGSVNIIFYLGICQNDFVIWDRSISNVGVCDQLKQPFCVFKMTPTQNKKIEYNNSVELNYTVLHFTAFFLLSSK